MNTSPQAPLLKTKLDSMLSRAATGPTAAIQSAPPSPSTLQAETQSSQTTKPEARGPAGVRASSRRDQFMDKLPAAQQVEILRWAEQHQIKPDETLWLLVDLMGYTKFMTETLPSRMHAAGQQAVDAIAQQRRAEADAFSVNTQKALRHMLTEITTQVAVASENITDVKLRKKLWSHGLFVASGISTLAAMCFVFGFTFASVHLPWIENYSQNVGIRVVQVILGVPAGYVIVPMFLTAAVIVLMEEITQWRKQRHG